MGMFDSIFLKVKCPFCGQFSEMECQTKDLDCQLLRWKMGENTDHPEVGELDCCATCHSPECLARGKRKSGEDWGNAAYFELIVETPLGLITGKYRIPFSKKLSSYD